MFGDPGKSRACFTPPLCHRCETASVRVLVVEDARALADAVARSLRRDGLAVDVVYDGAGALEHAAQTTYDGIVLDRDLPRVHGDAVCRALAGDHARILMLTASGEIE